MNIKHYDTEIEIKECFEVMKALRPKLTSVQDFAEQILRQQQSAYRILAVKENEKVVALAGYRELESLVHGKFIYVDDLVTEPESRGKNYGHHLLKEIGIIAQTKGKSAVVLDTGMANCMAQKFYYREGMIALGMHFVRSL